MSFAAQRGKTNIVVADKAALLDAVQNYTALFRKRNNRIVLKNAVLSENENKRWEERLNLYFEDCGCSAGIIFSIAGIGIYGLILVLFNIPHLSDTYFKIWMGMVVFIFSALAGKTTGLYLARRKFKAAVYQLLLVLD